MKKKSNKKNAKCNMCGENISFHPEGHYLCYKCWRMTHDSKDLAVKIVNYDCFTDIEFNHKKQYASQARSCALFKYLYLNNQVEDFLKEPLKFEYLYLNLQENSLF